MRKWISLVSVAALGDDVARGLLRLPLLCAMFCELIGKRIWMFREANELVLLGLLSVMDALLNVPMFDVLAQIPIDDAIKMALLGRPSRYRSIFEVVLNCESGTWEQLTESAGPIGLHENLLPDLYFQSVRWVGEVLCRVASACLRADRSLPFFCEHLFCNVKRGVRRWNTAIDS